MIDPRKKLLIKRSVVILLLALLTYLLLLFTGYPQLVEHYYTQGLYPLLCKLLHPVFNLFPLSVGDVLYIGITLYLFYAFFRFFKLLFTKRFLEVLILTAGMLINVQLALLIFYIFWGMNYFRPPAAERLNLSDNAYTITQLKTVTGILVDSANATRNRVSTADLQQSNDAIYRTAVLSVKILSGASVNYRTYSPAIKSSLLTLLLNYIGISGYYNPFTTEAQINYQMPVFTRPFVACHELSHQMGYAAEDEANFAGYMAGISSKDKLLRYSVYHAAVAEFMYTLRGADSVLYKKLKKSISPAVKEDFKQERLYWLSYQNKANLIVGVFYDHFLKANNQPAGLNTYNKMVSLIMAMYKKKAFRISPRNAQ